MKTHSDIYAEFVGSVPKTPSHAKQHGKNIELYQRSRDGFLSQEFSSNTCESSFFSSGISIFQLSFLLRVKPPMLVALVMSGRVFFFRMSVFSSGIVRLHHKFTF